MAEVVSNKSCSISFLGPPSCGKTSLIERITKNTFEENTTQATVSLNTVFMNFKIGTPSDDVKVRIEDTPGDQNLFDLTAKFIRDPSAIILVYDVSKPETIDFDAYITKIRDLNECPIFIVGNKSDLDLEGNNENDITSKLQKYKEMPNVFIDLPHVSAKTGNNVSNTLEYIVGKASQLEPKANGPDLKKKTSDSKKCC